MIHIILLRTELKECLYLYLILQLYNSVCGIWSTMYCTKAISTGCRMVSFPVITCNKHFEHLPFGHHGAPLGLQIIKGATFYSNFGPFKPKYQYNNFTISFYYLFFYYLLLWISSLFQFGQNSIQNNVETEIWAHVY